MTKLTPDLRKFILAMTITLVFSIVMILAALGYVKLGDSPGLLMLFGTLTALVGSVFNFDFGSSSSSERKTELLTAHPPDAAPTPPAQP